MLVKAKKSALIVEDDEILRESFIEALTLTRIFTQIVVAEDGVSATHKLSNQRFNVVLLDINLPKKSGLTVAKQLSNLNGNCPEEIIIISGAVDRNNLEQALSLGVKHFLVKPFDLDQLLEKINFVLEKS